MAVAVRFRSDPVYFEVQPHDIQASSGPLAPDSLQHKQAWTCGEILGMDDNPPAKARGLVSNSIDGVSSPAEPA